MCKRTVRKYVDSKKIYTSNLTKKQRYTQIAKGMWTNRTKTWATQSDTYSNPNTTSLLRVNYTILDPSNNTFSNPPNPFGCPTTVIQDGGNLVCNVVVDPCTQEVIKKTKSQQLCNPTTDSNVPGKIQPLCWNDGTQTWYPRQRYIMPTSGTKWPQGFKGFTSALTFVGPILSVGFIECGDLDIPLSWTFLDSTCAPITSFNIYQNELLILNVPVTQTSVTITGNLPGTYTYYVTSVSNTFQSEKSNIVVVNNTTTGYIIYGNHNTSYYGLYTYLTFFQNSSINFTCPINNVQVICVGGGGGGGVGMNIDNIPTAGGGGGGGGIGVLTTNITANQTFNITIGLGGTGTIMNGDAGGSSTFGSLISTGGGGGGGNNSLDNPNNGGLGGTSSNTYLGTFNGYNGGNGGHSGTPAQNGFDAGIITISTLGGITYSFSGGGGGGENKSPGNGGNAGNLGIGGGGGTFNFEGEGQAAFGNGSGGGGASNKGPNTTRYGGEGSPGVVIVIFLT